MLTTFVSLGGTRKIEQRGDKLGADHGQSWVNRGFHITVVRCTVSIGYSHLFRPSKDPPILTL